MENYPAGIYNIIIEIEDVSLEKARKHYFAMVSELAKHLGYLSRQDRELFKEQIKKELGHESIAEMLNPDDIYIKVEELHAFALKQFNYYFKPFIPEI